MLAMAMRKEQRKGNDLKGWERGNAKKGYLGEMLGGEGEKPEGKNG